MRVARALLVSATVAFGCGPGPDGVERAARGAGDSEPERITAIAPVVTVKGQGDATAFVVRSERTRLEVAEGGGTQAELEGVTGEIYREGRVASRFRAERAQVDQPGKTLVATGAVQVTEERRGLVLAAERIVYVERNGRIEARGAVTVSSQGAVWGPFSELWCDPGLSRFATPDRF